MTEATVDAERHLTSETKLDAFVRAVLERVGVGPGDAASAAEVLVRADLRGIEAHGAARLRSAFVDPIRAGTLAATPAVTVVRETPTSLVLDGGNGLGPAAARRAMLAVIDKAAAAGTAFGAVRNSNYFGIAGFYAMLALERDLIGIAATTAVRDAAPTGGREPALGSNPWAYAIPAAEEPAFVLDFATTAVPRDTVAGYARTDSALRPGWALDAAGMPTLDAARALTGALLPLGGFGTENGGHKGYGMGLLAEMMCALLSGGTFGRDVPVAGGPARRGAISHFFGAVRIDALRDLVAFKADMDRELRAFKTCERAPGFARIYVAGEIEHEHTLARRRDGIPVHGALWSDLRTLASELDVPFALAR